ncbi:hypothetical protein [Amycolatopsis granulosa]|uniref:hypothetical protein n=1 Tax=Amycolatopsis granulosa TaxID=185684 RepID=UPI001ABA4CD3|nr:hypothetical protein [Amycolatopsis granulosa]NIH88208.1 hypothetical protein [Amycolatopsis granulosa]
MGETTFSSGALEPPRAGWVVTDPFEVTSSASDSGWWCSRRAAASRRPSRWRSTSWASATATRSDAYHAAARIQGGHADRGGRRRDPALRRRGAPADPAPAPGQQSSQPTTRYPIRISVDRYPGDPQRSNQLYSESPLTRDEIDLHAWHGQHRAKPRDRTIHHDRDAFKEVWLLFAGAHGHFPLYPGEHCWIEYEYTVRAEHWGYWFQRAVRLPTRCRSPDSSIDQRSSTAASSAPVSLSTRDRPEDAVTSAAPWNTIAPGPRSVQILRHEQNR